MSMLSCPNAKCVGRKSGGFSLIGLHRHFRRYPVCEGFYVPQPTVTVCVERRTSGGDDLCNFDFDVSLESQNTNDINSELNNEKLNDIGEDEDFSKNIPCHVRQECVGYQEGIGKCPESTETITDNLPEICHELPPIVYDTAEVNTMSPLDWVKQWILVTKSRNDDQMFHPSGLPDDITLLEMLVNDPNYHQGWHVISDVEKAEIRLIHRLNKIKGCPLFVYDAVRDWARENLSSPNADETNSDQVLQMMKSREQLKKEGPKFAHTSAMKPTTLPVHLPGCGKSVDITTMSYLGNFYNLLTSNNLVNDDTLLLNGDNPYADPVIPRHNFKLDDFNTGTRYVQAWSHMKRADIDFPIGEVLFVDKSNYDFGDRLTSEPVMHTNSLIRCVARNKSAAWFNLGTIPSFKSLAYTETRDKMIDYHKCLEHIFREYIHVQKTKSGILWPLLYKGKYYMVRFRPYMLTCLGDTPGQNVLAGKSCGHRKCRYCDVEKDNLSDPWIVSNFITEQRHDEILKSSSLCQEYGYLQCSLVWSRINFGNDPCGIHGNLPGEILHAYEKGLMVRVLDGLVAVPKMSQSARKADKRLFLDNVKEVFNEQEDDALPTMDVAVVDVKDTTQEDLIKRGVFGGGMGKMVNEISKTLGEQLAHQSDRNICRTYFPQGIMVRSKMTASEQQGLTLLFAMILSSTWSLQEGGLRDNLGDNRIGGYIMVLETLMCLEELLKMHPGKSSRNLMKRDIPSVSSYTKSIMSKASLLVNRTTGDGFNLIKFHLITHMIDHDLHKYGLPRNTSGSPGESQFKDNFKLPASTTQKRDYSFDRQVAERHYEHLTITRCMQRIDRANNHYLREPTRVPMEDHFGSVMRNERNDESNTTQYLSNPIGLSDPMYSVLQVFRNSVFNKANETARLEIVFNGRVTTGRAGKFPRIEDDHLVGLDGKQAGTKGIDVLSGVNDSFQDMVRYLVPLFDVVPDYRVDVFTVLKVKKKQYQEKDIIYRADPCCSVTHAKRHDWALFEWEDSNQPVGKTQVPGQILGFLDVDDKFIHIYNMSIATKRPGTPPLTDKGQYAFIISLENEIPALMDPTITEISPDVVMQSNSVLFFWGEQETEVVNAMGRRKGRSPIAEKRVPIVRLVDVSSIVRPLIVVPDFSPTFSGSKKGVNIDLWVETDKRQFAWIIVRPRDVWHHVFLELATEHHKNEMAELANDAQEVIHGKRKRGRR